MDGQPMSDGRACFEETKLLFVMLEQRKIGPVQTFSDAAQFYCTNKLVKLHVGMFMLVFPRLKIFFCK